MKSARKQTSLEIQFYIGFHSSGIVFESFSVLSAISPSPYHHVKVWVLGGFNEDYDWQEGEEGFLSTTEVALVINVIFASPYLPLSSTASS